MPNPVSQELKWLYFCTSDNEKEWISSDKSWYSDLQNTKWLQRISMVLKLSCNVAQLLHDGSKNVVIKGIFCRKKDDLPILYDADVS